MAIKMNPKGFLALQCLVTHVTHELMIQITFKTKSVLAFELVNRPRYVCSWCDGQERELELRNKREREYITHSDAAASQNNTRLKYEEVSRASKLGISNKSIDQCSHDAVSTFLFMRASTGTGLPKNKGAWSVT